MPNTVFQRLIRTALLVMLVISWITPERVQAVATIEVNSTSDEDDDNYGDYICHTISGFCSLRAAIRTANYLQDINGTTITFSISPDSMPMERVIRIYSALPTLNEKITIQGPNIGSLGGGAPIVLDGQGGTYDGLDIRESGCAIKKLTIRNFNGDGIYVYQVSGALITGNKIGEFGTGIGTFNGNTGSGIYLAKSNSVVIGGDDAASRNYISGNDLSGIQIADAGTNLIRGNYIGISTDGTTALPNQTGIYLNNSDGNTIGGIIAGRRNIISGNTRDGINIYNSENNIVWGNYVGTNADGTAALGNGWSGISINGTTDSDPYYYGNEVGGTSLGSGNLVSGNIDAGIRLQYAAETIIQGNVIGLNANQTAALPNENGIMSYSSENTQIGGTDSYARNIISGNSWNGILLYEQVTHNTVIQGNLIGLNAGGAAFGNGYDGIYDQYSLESIIGGTETGAGNVIANNGRNGIQGQFNYGNNIKGNSIFNNTNLGIDIRGWEAAGVTPNDPADADSMQNFPILSRIFYSDTTHVTVQGTLNSTTATSFTISFYGNHSCDPSGFGEGEVFLGTTTTSTGADNEASFSVVLPITENFFWYTATAHYVGRGTSEFSPCRAVGMLYLPLLIK